MASEAVPATAAAAAAGASEAKEAPSDLQGVEKLLAELYIVHDTVFTKDPAEKAKRMQGMIDGIVTEVKAMDPKTAAERANVAYWQGKALDALDEYNKEAETLLSQAIKLSPSNVDAWNRLGNCLWKKGDKEGAARCFNCALEQEKNKASLRQLSMLMRQMGDTPQERDANIKASVQRAKDAVGLDVADAESWYLLGNAYLSVFFASQHKPADLQSAMKAYSRASSLGGDSNPDLHFNRANVMQYLEDYDDALASYRKAVAIDPSLGAAEEVDGIIRHVTRVADLVATKAKMKKKRLTALAKSLPSEAIKASVAESKDAGDREFVGLEDLKEGANPGKMLLLKLVMPAIRDGHPPACLVMMDEYTNVMALSLYHLTEKACNRFSDRDVFIALEPHVKTVTVTTDAGKTLSYRCIHILHPNNFYVNGKSVSGAFVHEDLRIVNRSS